jgi:hypothetical protein
MLLPVIVFESLLTVAAKVIYIITLLFKCTAVLICLNHFAVYLLIDERKMICV